MGYEDGERRELQKNLFSSQKSLTDLCSALTVAKIDYVLIDRPVRDEEYGSPKGSLMKSFQPIFTYPTNQDDPEIYIYDVAQNCQN